MGNIFFKSIKIENYKCFGGPADIELNVPDGEHEGSGLTLLIGNNGSGKTTILEAIELLTLNSYAVENKLSINDFNNFDKKIKIEGDTHEEFDCKPVKLFNKAHKYPSFGIQTTIKPRDSKEKNSILSSPISISTQFKSEAKEIKYTTSSSSQKLEGLDYYFSNERIANDSVNIFYFDKNRTKHLLSGAYKTTFDKICEDLNWKFVKGLKGSKSEEIQEIIKSYKDKVISLMESGMGGAKDLNKLLKEGLSKEVSNFFKDEQYKGLSLEIIALLKPFSSAFFGITDQFKQISSDKLGSGIEIVLTLLLMKNLYESAGGSLIYLIDEPELHLHPTAQDQLAKFLLKESKDKQIVIATHSPYLIKHLINENRKCWRVKKGTNNPELKELTTDKFFSWSPSWSEINYRAFGLYTEEFHNELYGYLQQKSKMSEISKFDKYLEENHSVAVGKIWKKKNDNEKDGIKEYHVTLHTYIRNTIHHPENKENKEYTEADMKASIEEMIEILHKE